MAYNTVPQALVSGTRTSSVVGQFALQAWTGTTSVPASGQYLSVSNPLRDVPIAYPTKSISGIIYAGAGIPVAAGTIVKLVRQVDDRVVQSTTTDSSGRYVFVRDVTDTYLYYVMSYTSGIPQTHGISDRGLVPS